MKKTDISVIIPAYNEEKFIKQCIEAVKKQETHLNYEIIVVDNNSKDRTKEIAKSQNVKVVNEKVQGVGAARRTGTVHSKGEIVVHIDADTIIPTNHLEKVWEHFKKDKELVCLGGQFLFYDAPLWKIFLRKLLFKPIMYSVIIFSRKTLGPPGGNMAFRVDTYKKTKGFDKKLKFGEDLELCRHLKNFGKIKVDMNLKVLVSSRRFDLNKDFFIYSMNFLSACIRKTPYKNKL